MSQVYVKRDLSLNPQCLHGPSLVFLANNKTSFYACSACRDVNTQCFRFLSVDNNKSPNKEKKEQILLEKQKAIQAYTSGINHNELYQIFQQVRLSFWKSRRYCLTCSRFILLTNESEHVSHVTRERLTDDEINFPSTFLKPLENNKKEAQYFFVESTIKTVINALRAQNLTNVICIAAPRMHEYIQNYYKDMRSILLDVDKRYYNFYSPQKFCWYNLFNNHFFKPESKRYYLDFLKLDDGKKTALIMDPPFGGRTEPISDTIESINNEIKTVNNITKNLPIIFFFPYFMEMHVIGRISDLQMTDYRVNYENHDSFSAGAKGRKLGSPVRIFTNIKLSEFKLDGDYRYCELCEKYVHKLNEHCYICNICPSKDGRVYKHCDLCKKCVKPVYFHCNECKICRATDHKCLNLQNKFFKNNCLLKQNEKQNSVIEKSENSKQNSKKCFLCQKVGHGVKQCPVYRENNEEEDLAHKKPGHTIKTFLTEQKLDKDEDGKLKKKISKKCSHCQKFGHTLEKCFFRLRNILPKNAAKLKKKIEKTNIKCHHCQQKGHTISSCPEKLFKEKQIKANRPCIQCQQFGHTITSCPHFKNPLKKNGNANPHESKKSRQSIEDKNKTLKREPEDNDRIKSNKRIKLMSSQLTAFI